MQKFKKNEKSWRNGLRVHILDFEQNKEYIGLFAIFLFTLP